MKCPPKLSSVSELNLNKIFSIFCLFAFNIRTAKSGFSAWLKINDLAVCSFQPLDGGGWITSSAINPQEIPYFSEMFVDFRINRSSEVRLDSIANDG